jgi:SAM-dependent methyltransferase
MSLNAPLSGSSSITTQHVIDHYSTLAREDSVKNGEHIKKVAESFGYAPEDLATIPEGANLGLSCGNPFAVAGVKAVSLSYLISLLHLLRFFILTIPLEDNIKSRDANTVKGETVIDLGSGAGFDVFQAARKVGPTGLSIGVDMSQDMLSRAKLNAEKSSITNVKFVLSPITKIPLESESADCIISNCVINLLAQDEKPVCFAEVFRLLKPGGRLAVSDILAKKEFPEELRKDLALYVGCISGASLVKEYEVWLKQVGFEGMSSPPIPVLRPIRSEPDRMTDIMIVDKKSDLNIYKERVYGESSSSCCATITNKNGETIEASSCCAPSNGTSKNTKVDENSKVELAKRVENINFNDWVSKYCLMFSSWDLAQRYNQARSVSTQSNRTRQISSCLFHMLEFLEKLKVSWSISIIGTFAIHKSKRR